MTDLTLQQIEDKYKFRTMSKLYEMSKHALKPEGIVLWFSTPNECLGGKSPFEMCLTDEGYDAVEQLLAAIIYGLPL